MKRAPSIASLLAVIGVASIGGGLLRVATSLYAVRLDASPAQLGLLAACPSLGLVLGSLPASALVRRHGPAAVFMTGSLLGGILCAGLPLVRDAWALVSFLAAVALCMPLRVVTMNVAVMERLEREGHRRAGWYRALQLLGMHVAGPSLAVPTVGALGFPAAWWVVALTFALPAWAARSGLARARRPPGDRPAAPLRDALADREALPLAATELMAQGAFTYFSFFVIPIAVRQYGFGAASAAGLVSAQAASFVLALLALGGLASRWPRGRLVAGAYGATLAGLLLLGAPPDGSWLWVGGGLLGAGLGLVQLDNLVRAARMGVRTGRELASSLQALAGASGGLLGGLLGGLAGHALGYQAPFLLLAPTFAWLGWRQLDWALSPPLVASPGAPGGVPSRSSASSCGPGACEG